MNNDSRYNETFNIYYLLIYSSEKLTVSFLFPVCLFIISLLFALKPAPFFCHDSLLDGVRDVDEDASASATRSCVVSGRKKRRSKSTVT